MLVTNEIAEKYKELDNIRLEYEFYVKKNGITTKILNEDIKSPLTTEDGVLVNPIGKVPMGTINAQIRGELAKEYYEDEGYEIKFHVSNDFEKHSQNLEDIHFVASDVLLSNNATWQMYGNITWEELDGN